MQLKNIKKKKPFSVSFQPRAPKDQHLKDKSKTNILFYRDCTLDRTVFKNGALQARGFVLYNLNHVLLRSWNVYLFSVTKRMGSLQSYLFVLVFFVNVNKKKVNVVSTSAKKRQQFSVKSRRPQSCPLQWRTVAPHDKCISTFCRVSAKGGAELSKCLVCFKKKPVCTTGDVYSFCICGPRFGRVLVVTWSGASWWICDKKLVLDFCFCLVFFLNKWAKINIKCMNVSSYLSLCRKTPSHQEMTIRGLSFKRYIIFYIIHFCTHMSPHGQTRQNKHGYEQVHFCIVKGCILFNHWYIMNTLPIVPSL